MDRDMAKRIIKKAIPGVPAKYKAGDNGKIYSGTKDPSKAGGVTWNPIKAHRNSRGCMLVAVVIDGKPTSRAVGRLVCAAFHGLPAGGDVCRFDDEDRSNTRPENLYWGPRACVGKRGEQAHNAILSDVDRAGIQWVMGLGITTLTELGDALGVELQTVWNVQHGPGYRLIAESTDETEVAA